MHFLHSVVNHVVARKLVPLDYELVVQVPGFADVNVNLEKLNNSGMIRSVKAPGSNLYYFDAPLICLQVMNNLAVFKDQAVIPAILDVSNPFEESWQALERVALATLLAHVMEQLEMDSFEYFFDATYLIDFQFLLRLS